MDALEMSLLYDYYGGLLTGKQRQCFDLRYNQDLSLGEIAQVMGVSRQAVNDNALRTILDAAERLKTYPDETVSALAGEIIEAAQDFEE